jgi:hypothetical protein
MKFNRIARGHQATPDGRYAVVIDGYSPIKSAGAEGDYEGFQGGEWAAIFDPNGELRDDHNAGQNLDWYPTAREAKAACQRHADRH